MIINPFKSASFFREIYKDDKKLRDNIMIKNRLLKISASKTLKFNTLNISFVSSLLNNNGVIITAEPFKKNKHSDIKNFLLKGNTVSSLPKWQAATTKKNNRTVLGNINQSIIIKNEMNIYAK